MKAYDEKVAIVIAQCFYSELLFLHIWKEDIKELVSVVPARPPIYTPLIYLASRGHAAIMNVQGSSPYQYDKPKIGAMGMKF